MNARFADHLTKLLRRDDIIWIHDAGFWPARMNCRRGIRNLRILPAYAAAGPDVLTAVLPGHRRLMESLAQCDLVGFQTENVSGAFATTPSMKRAGGSPRTAASRCSGTGPAPGRSPSGSMSGSSRPPLRRRAAGGTMRLVENLGKRQLIIGVDRLDYSKGIPNRIEAIDELLRAEPARRSGITFVQIAAPSRIDVRRYRNLKRNRRRRRQGQQASRRDRLGTGPLSQPDHRQAAIGRIPGGAGGAGDSRLRDGMNLVAKVWRRSARGDPACWSSPASPGRPLSVVGALDRQSVRCRGGGGGALEGAGHAA